jgi:hypothetical protein
MTRQLTSHRMALPPPPVAERGRTASPRRLADTPSAATFVAKVIFAAIAIVMAAALIASASPAVTIPLATVLVAGLVASGLVVAADRWLAGRYRRRRRQRRSVVRNAADQRLDGHRRAEHSPDAPGGARGWGALAAVSVALLLLATVVPEGPGIAMSAIGLAGLLVFRLATMYDGWAPAGPFRQSRS